MRSAFASDISGNEGALLDNVLLTTGVTPPPSVPEPSSLALIGGALLGVGFARRRVGNKDANG
jgi:hypothetical protein